MAIGERIKHIRKLRKMTQKELGSAVGFDEKTADIRMAQYESGTRTPKADLISMLADELGVSKNALNVPNIETTLGLIHTLFAIEDIYGISVELIDGKYVLSVDGNAGEKSGELLSAIEDWYSLKSQFTAGEIDEDEYNLLRYNYPDSGKIFVKKERSVAKKKVGEENTEDKKAPSRTVDDILANLRANLDKLKSIQNGEETE